MFSLAELEAAAELVHMHMPPTPAYAWPLLGARLGAEVWVKHENHTPIGAFKVRGGIVYLDALERSGAPIAGVITATRGNHGQSIARAATSVGIPATILVPHGNSVEKNAAMRGFGAELIEHGADFDEAKAEAARLAESRNLHMIPPFHADLVKGVSTYALEFFRAVPDLDAVFVPIGMGSGICGTIAARDLLGLKTQVVGVVADNAAAYALSFAAGKPVATNTARTFADGMAVREPHPHAVEIVLRGAEEIISVSEDDIAQAMRIYYEDCHTLAEGAGAASLAALLSEKTRWSGRKVGVILSGGNVDRPVYRTVLAGQTPVV
ncbi:MAG: threonine dehydratase [Hyphomicrobiaceae bacterium]